MIALRLQYSMLNVQVCRLLPTSHGCVPDCFCWSESRENYMCGGDSLHKATDASLLCDLRSPVLVAVPPFHTLHPLRGIINMESA